MKMQRATLYRRPRLEEQTTIPRRQPLHPQSLEEVSRVLLLLREEEALPREGEVLES